MFSHNSLWTNQIRPQTIVDESDSPTVFSGLAWVNRMKEVIQAERLFFGCMPCIQKNAAEDSTFGWAVYGPERPLGLQPKAQGAWVRVGDDRRTLKECRRPFTSSPALLQSARRDLGHSQGLRGFATATLG